MSRTNLTILGGIGCALAVALGVLFGSAGLMTGTLLGILLLSGFVILTRIGFDAEFSFALGIPLGIVFVSTVSYGLGFLTGLYPALIISLGIIIAAAIGLFFFKNAKHKREHIPHTKP